MVEAGAMAVFGAPLGTSSGIDEVVNEDASPPGRRYRWFDVPRVRFGGVGLDRYGGGEEPVAQTSG
jgi:hypothetical protein